MTPSVLLIGHGAIAAEVQRYAKATGAYGIGGLLIRPDRRAAVAREHPDMPVLSSVEDLTFRPSLAVECASHDAVRQHGPALLRQGIDLVVASTGALADDALSAALVEAARAGGAQIVLASGAIPGIDALSAARLGGLDRVSYTSRKPPGAWRGTPAEAVVDLQRLDRPETFFSGSARSAARDYPKNANVAASVALATLGLDDTETRLIADPDIRENRHEVTASGAFGELRLEVAGRPLPGNPKTSSLAAYSVIRAILNRVSPIVL